MSLVLRLLLELALLLTRPVGIRALGVGVGVRVLDGRMTCVVHDLVLMVDDRWTYSDAGRPCPCDVALEVVGSPEGL